MAVAGDSDRDWDNGPTLLLLFLIAAAITDAFVWPILFREAVHECLAIEE